MLDIKKVHLMILVAVAMMNIHIPVSTPNKRKCQQKINNVNVTMIIDTGAIINIIDEQTFARVNANKNIRMQRTRTKTFAYGSEQHLPVLGKFEMTMETKNGLQLQQFMLSKEIMVHC